MILSNRKFCNARRTAPDQAFLSETIQTSFNNFQIQQQKDVKENQLFRVATLFDKDLVT